MASLLERAGSTNGRLERVEAQVTQLIPHDLSTQLKSLQAAVSNLNEFVTQVPSTPLPLLFLLLPISLLYDSCLPCMMLVICSVACLAIMI